MTATSHRMHRHTRIYIKGPRNSVLRKQHYILVYADDKTELLTDGQ